jgi:hypothetical protein
MSLTRRDWLAGTAQDARAHFQAGTYGQGALNALW